MRGIIDRFEGEYAVCEIEPGKMVNIDRHKLPEESAEGDVIIIEDDNIIIDKCETEKRKAKIEKLMGEL